MLPYRPDGYWSLGRSRAGFTFRHLFEGRFRLDLLQPGLHEPAVQMTRSIIRAFVGKANYYALG